MSLPFNTGDLILFTGDSVTDCDRIRRDPTSLGTGYASMIARRLQQEHPDQYLRFRNTGISGDRTCDLLERWERDCIDLQPDWISLLVGVNNTLRRYDVNDPTSDMKFEVEYRKLLHRIKDDTAAGIILGAPFLLHTDPEIAGMREDLDPKIAIVKALALEFGGIWVDFDAAFVAAEQRHVPAYWAADGAHPTEAGHALMAETWLTAMGR